MHRQLPHTSDDRRHMLDAIGVDEKSLIPETAGKAIKSWAGTGEAELLAELAALDQPVATKRGGFGLGAFFIPSVVDAIASRGEFVTAYTPYQPECAQGTLSVIFEYQTRVCELTGLDVSNAGLYDGATAAAEAAVMAASETGRGEIAVARSVAPRTREVLRTLLLERGLTLRELPFDPKTGQTLVENVAGPASAGVLLQSPNVFGLVERNAAEIFDAARNAGAKAVQIFHPLAVTLFGRPSDLGADIACAEGQPLGIPLSAGGPYLGLIAAKKDLVRRMPGRIVGQTVDAAGRDCFVLTLQTREQHIRRERATSNICSNQALMALRTTLFLASLGGRDGLKRYAAAIHDRAVKAAAGRALFAGEFFNEFVVRGTSGWPLDYPELGECSLEAVL